MFGKSAGEGLHDLDAVGDNPMEGVVYDNYVVRDEPMEDVLFDQP